MIKRRLLILLSAVMALVTSCTYDYFLDESNYQLFIPEVLNGEVGDCYVLVYDESGNIAGIRHWTPGSDPRMDEGLFAFRLNPGNYTVYIFTDFDSTLVFGNTGNLGDPNAPKPGDPDFPGIPAPGASFTVGPVPGIPDGGVPQPAGDTRFDKTNPQIGEVGPLKTDTLSLKTYPGRITVRFQRFEVPIDQIAYAEVEVRGVGTTQYLRDDSIPYAGDGYVYRLYNPIVKGDTDDILMVFDGYYFPSIPGEEIVFTIKFYDAEGNFLRERTFSVLDEQKQPIALHAGEHLIVDVSEEGFKIVIEPWTPGITGGNYTEF